MKEIKMIITKDGLFYSNYDKSKFTAFGALDELLDPDRNVLFALCPYLFSRSILYIRETYGLKISEPQPYGNGMISDDVVGLYIVDYGRYLSDVKEKSLNLSKKFGK